PLHDSLATTENLIGWQLFYTPLRLLGCGPVAAYNTLIVVSFVLSGLGAALLARRFGVERGGAVIAGFIFAFVPFHLNHVIHIQTMAVCYCPFALYFFDRFLSRTSLRATLGLAAFFLVTVLSGIYIGPFLLLVLALYAIVCWSLSRPPFRPQTAARLAGIALVCAGLLLSGARLLRPVPRASPEGPRGRSDGIPAARKDLHGVLGNSMADANPASCGALRSTACGSWLLETDAAIRLPDSTRGSDVDDT